MLNFNNIKSLHIEPTSYCNASCPMCARNINGGRQNPKLYLSELTLHDVKNFFPIELLKNLDEVFFCGSYGEPILTKEILKISSYFIDNCGSQTQFFFDTNGSVRQPNWWIEFAKILPTKRSLVAFGIDGLSSTHAIHRRGTSFETIIENARAFIDAGGNARWSFLVFKHNEHQVEDARLLSRKMGFKSFLLKKSGRFFSSRDLSARESHPVWNKKDELEYYIEPPINPEYRNTAVDQVDNLNDNYVDMKDYLDKTQISCESLIKKRIYVAANGVVLPCGYLNHQLFDSEDLYGESQSQLARMIDVNKLSLTQFSLKEILASKDFNKIFKSWGIKSIKDGRLKTCALFCGKKFRKVDAQLNGKYGL